jgi:hypothetical protein
MNLTTRNRTVLILAGSLLVAGCASPPSLELQQAREAVAGARDFEADVYAPDQYQLALMNLQMAERAIADQEQAPPMTRSYDYALQLIGRAIDEAETAQLMAEDFKSQNFLQAESTLPTAQTALDDAFDALGRASNVLAFQERQTLQAQLQEATGSLAIARQEMEAGAYADAVVRLDEIVITARAVQTRADFVVETNP